MIIAEMSEKFQRIHDALPENNFSPEDQAHIRTLLNTLLQDPDSSLPSLTESQLQINTLLRTFMTPSKDSCHLILNFLRYLDKKYDTLRKQLNELESLRKEDKLKFETIKNRCEDLQIENERMKDKVRESEIMMVDSMNSTMNKRFES